MLPTWYTPPPPRNMKTRDQRFIEEACYLSNISRDELLSGDRHNAFAMPRHAVRYVLSRVRPDYSLTQIGRITGTYDHTTVRNSIMRAKELRQKDKNFNELVLKLESLAW